MTSSRLGFLNNESTGALLPGAQQPWWAATASLDEFD
jgi:hypothetical protein